MDLLWLDDMDPFALETTSDSQELEQDVIHVIEQDLASNPDDPSRGLGVANASSEQVSANPTAYTQAAEQEVQKDDRVVSCSASITVTNDGSVALVIDIEEDDAQLDVKYQVPT
jgi:hypothetical protein